MAGRRKDPNTGLTKQQYHFCREFVKSGNKSDAYREAYSCKGMKAASIHANSSALMANTAVALCIASMQTETDAAASKELGLTREFVIAGLMANAKAGAKEIRTKDGESVPINLAASNQAFQLLGKVDTLGLFVERSKIELSKTFEEQTDEELAAFIASHTSNT
jgi:phage terminase small subunit